MVETVKGCLKEQKNTISIKIPLHLTSFFPQDALSAILVTKWS